MNSYFLSAVIIALLQFNFHFLTLFSVAEHSPFRSGYREAVVPVSPGLDASAAHPGSAAANAAYPERGCVDAAKGCRMRRNPRPLTVQTSTPSP